MVYGITGGIGSGKSTVAKIMEEQGCVVIDADQLSREVTASGAPLLKVLVKYFGEEILNEDGSLNRRLLANIAFSDEEKTRRLNDMVQTAIKVRYLDIVNKMRHNGDYRDVCFDAPLLFESGCENLVDEVWLVTADLEDRIRRVQNRDGLTREEIMQRIDLQMPEDEKARRSTLIIVADGDMDHLRKQVIDALEERI